MIIISIINDDMTVTLSDDHDYNNVTVTMSVIMNNLSIDIYKMQYMCIQ